MANYYGTARSNYVEVTDKEKFKEICEKYGLTFIEGKGKVGFLTDEIENGYLPDCFYIEEKDEELDGDPLEELALLLKDNEVLIFQHIGAEKYRFLNGYSKAINNQLKTKEIGIENIYEIAEELGKNITECIY